MAVLFPLPGQGGIHLEDVAHPHAVGDQPPRDSKGAIPLVEEVRPVGRQDITEDALDGHIVPEMPQGSGQAPVVR